MCRLFGLIANKEVDAEFSFLKADIPFKELGKKNPHGWGIGYYKNNSPKIIKEPKSTIESKQFNQEVLVNSNIIISHVRKKSDGDKKKENTHPFQYHDWIFAHNGNIDIKAELQESLNSDFRNSLKGQTDSEVFFYWLIQNIEEEDDLAEGIKKSVDFIETNKGSRTTSLNFILIDRNCLIALRKAFTNIDYYSLYYLYRDPNNLAPFKFKSRETEQLIKSKILNNEKAVLVCSEKLTKEEKWEPLSNDQLIIVDRALTINKIVI